MNAYTFKPSDTVVSERRDTTTLQLPVLVPSPVRCAECVSRLRSGILALPGVSFAEVDEHAAALTVVHDPETITDAELRAAALRLGIVVAEDIGHMAYRISGLD